MYGIFLCLIFYGFHVGKYTIPMDPMGYILSWQSRPSCWYPKPVPQS